MIDFEPIEKKKGDLIESADWNEIQKSIRKDLLNLEKKLTTLREDINKLTETVTITNLGSSVGKSYRLTDLVYDEFGAFKIDTIGLITKQWVPITPGIGEICNFGIVDTFDILYYWATADNGDKETLSIEIEYVGQNDASNEISDMPSIEEDSSNYNNEDGDNSIKYFENLFINEMSRLSEKGKNNGWEEYLYTDAGIWYKYKLRNPYPRREVSYVKFTNTNPDCNVRIGDVIHLKKRLKSIDTYLTT